MSSFRADRFKNEDGAVEGKCGVEEEGSLASGFGVPEEEERRTSDRGDCWNDFSNSWKRGAEVPEEEGVDRKELSPLRFATK